MSAVLPQSASLDGAARGLPRWLHAWSRMGTRHLVAWLLASALMSVVDFTAMIDKLGKPGVSLMMAFDLTTSLILFGTTLLAWVAATDGAPISGRARNVRVGWAIVIGAVAAACLVGAADAGAGDRQAVVGDVGQGQATASPVPRADRQRDPVRCVVGPVRGRGRGDTAPRPHERSHPRDAARAGGTRARCSGVAPGCDAGAGRAAVPVRHARGHRAPVPEGHELAPPRISTGSLPICAWPCRGCASPARRWPPRSS